MAGQGRATDIKATLNASRQDFRQEVQALYAEGVRARIDAALITEAPFVERMVQICSNYFCISADCPRVTASAAGFAFVVGPAWQANSTKTAKDFACHKPKSHDADELRNTEQHRSGRCGDTAFALVSDAAEQRNWFAEFVSSLCAERSRDQTERSAGLGRSVLDGEQTP